jgi:hypothetical protein
MKAFKDQIKALIGIFCLPGDYDCLKALLICNIAELYM